MKETNEKVEYFVARYSIIPDNQITMERFLENKSKEEVFIDWLNSFNERPRLEVPHRNNEYVLFCKNIERYRYVLNFAKKKSQMIGQKTEIDIVNTEIDDYKKCTILLDSEQQIMLIERNYEISNKIIQQKQCIEKVLTEAVKKSLYIKIDLITLKSNFWNYVRKNSDCIKSLEISLNSPNFLRGIHTVNDFLNSLKETYNNTLTKMSLENSDGKLTISENDIFLKDAIKYTSSGCGNWKIRTSHSSKPYTSDNFPLIENISKNISYLNDKDIHEIQYVFDKVNNIDQSNRNGDD